MDRVEGFCWEINAAEQFAGVFGTAGIVAALLIRDAVFQSGQTQLGIPFQADGGELTDADLQPFCLTGEYQFCIKAVKDTGGDITRRTFLPAAVAQFNNFRSQNHGVQRLYNSPGHILAQNGFAIQLVQRCGAVEYFRAAAAAEEGHPDDITAVAIRLCLPEED